MIEFENIRYKNLLSSGNYWTSFNLNDTQNSLIIGKNGAGKSTVLDALCFVLFGKAFRNINKPLLVNSINKKDCIVEIEFNTNNKKYKIIRGIKPNIFQIFQDGELLNQEAATKDYQEILEKSILKFNFKSFTQIVILGSASFVPFMQLSAGDRRNIIEDLLDIHIFSTMNLIIKDKTSNNKDLINNKKSQIELTKQRYDLEKKHLDSLKQNNEEKIKEYELEIDKSTDSTTKIIGEVEKLSEIAVKLQESINDKLDIEGIIKKLIKIESTVENRLSKYTSDINFFEKNNDCPVCRQRIDENFKLTEINRLSTEVDTIKVGLVKLEAKLNSEQQKLNIVNEKQSNLHKIQMRIASNNAAVNETNKYIIKIRNQVISLKDTKNLNERDEVEINKISDELNTLQDELKNFIEEKVYYDAAILLLKDSGIKTKIIKQYLPIINKLVNKYLSSLDFFVNFNLDESFKETIKSRHRDEFTYNNFSEGEKTKINLALLFAWREIAKIKNSAHTNLLILDEIFDSSLDDIGIDYLLKILHDMENINIHVISHKGDILFDKFDRVLVFDKVKNFSKMKKM
ncbi:AAA family ATPase [Candidatus Dojkabacteria bacterium]|jgi:DNA repair exonuclease SbcCD ATPase subunit|nr:AAA family ATPase [Candidatus Dojkabacteria bacterium]